MNTDTFGLLMPAIIEEFGEHRNIDIMLSLSHSLIADKLENPRVSGLQLDKNGNFRLTLNVAAQILVEKKGYQDRGMYDEARSFYTSFVAKGKLLIEEVGPNMKILKIIPKNAEVQNMKIFKADGEEQVVE